MKRRESHKALYMSYEIHNIPNQMIFLSIYYPHFTFALVFAWIPLTLVVYSHRIDLVLCHLGMGERVKDGEGSGAAWEVVGWRRKQAEGKRGFHQPPTVPSLFPSFGRVNKPLSIGLCLKKRAGLICVLRKDVEVLTPKYL